MVSKFMQIDNIRQRCDGLHAANERQNVVIMELTSKTNEAEDDLSALKCTIESFRMNFEMQKMKTGMLSEDVQELVERLDAMGGAGQAVVDGGNLDLAALSKSFASKTELDNFNNRLAALEANDSK